MSILLFGTAKKKASEELGEARTVWEALQKELDSRKCAAFIQRAPQGHAP